ncbi:MULTISPECIES: hypothetical protein [Pseudomonas]|uniref:Uncharacterized protein n=1 Tax=Pseudomonas protegens TaxID=380021 RepID=A0A2T6GRC8_9PSED|nr:MULTISPECIES: hypothetical protein [Pseudomonas]PUA46715.1 hypothetical protein C5U62_01670 [Pseudomonas protegens]RXU67686.1 hypothetical protein CW358_06270 [Pseudomonas protegens]ULT68407.1 hypothetical protein L1O02_18540 [Pseudomonas sp. BC42]BAQ74159.1 uncharacterized protein POS17_2465 [Pseudomonas sp. Os17]BAQ80457.1 uncharacterized protein PST29_2568 [Pseudomonas sp. St29]
MSETPLHRDSPLASNVWTWYGQDEYRKIILLGELGPALEFLASEADRQRTEVGCCAECGLWSNHLDYLEGFVKHFPAYLAPTLHPRLQALLSGCEALCREAYGVTLEDNGFKHPQWLPLRQEARELLGMLGWQDVREHMPELIEECRASLRKWPD